MSRIFGVGRPAYPVDRAFGAVESRRMLFKLIEYVVEGRRTMRIFDIETDPFETINLADLPEYRKQLLRMRKELMRWKEELGDTRDEGTAFWQAY